MRSAFEEHQTALGNPGDGERFMTEDGLLAVVGDLGAASELLLLEVGERTVFLGVEDLRGEDAGRLIGDLDAEREGSLLLCG